MFLNANAPQNRSVKRGRVSNSIIRRVFLARAPYIQRLQLRRLHAIRPVYVQRSDRASHEAPACVSNEVSRLTPTPNIFWAKKSLARTAAVHFRVPCRAARSLARLLVLVHVRGSPMQTPTTIAAGPAPGFRVGFSPWKRRDCRGPTWPSEA